MQILKIKLAEQEKHPHTLHFTDNNLFPEQGNVSDIAQVATFLLNLFNL